MDFDKLIKEAQNSFDKNLKNSIELSKMDSASIVDMLLNKFDELGMSDWKGKRRDPASKEEIEAIENKLKINFPDSAKDFYHSVNGIENIGGDLPYAMFTLQELKFGNDSLQNISSSIKQIQKRYEQKVGENVQVMNVLSTEDLFSSLSGNYMASITPEEADEFWLLSSCSGHTVGLCVKEIQGIIPGNVLHFEGSTGTFYNNINHWLASGIR